MAPRRRRPDARTGPDGGFDTCGSPAWIWVSDVGTGARFDMRADQVAAAVGVRVVPNYSINYGGAGRLSKPRRPLATLCVKA